MAVGTGCGVGAKAKTPGGIATPSIRATLAALEAERTDDSREPLTELPEEHRRRLIARSGLLERPGAPALIAAALSDGIVPRHIYQAFLEGHPRHGSGWLVEQLLPLRAVERKAISPKLREAVFARDGHRCCLEHLGGCYGKLRLDHFLPVILGGPTIIANVVENPLENLWALCHFHNMAKFGHWPDEEVEAAFLANGRKLPQIYLDLLAQRPWRDAHDLDQSWWEEVASHRRRQRRQQLQRRRESLRSLAAGRHSRGRTQQLRWTP
jgi:hypothetical protein